MSIEKVAYKINDLSRSYNVGNLQKLRKDLKGLGKIPTRDIFNSSSINVDGEWAFHVGGRKEVQFNISFEDIDYLRFGLAFSLEASQSLPNPIEVLSPKVDRFNEFLKTNAEYATGYSMWYFFDGKRSETLPLTIIPKDWIKYGAFIFVGKYVEKKLEELSDSDYDYLLKTFDHLLSLYEFVESHDVPQKEVESKIARICWNVFNWQRPSGKEAKSKNEDSHEAREGYGHEEWLLDTSKILNGYHYGFIQCFNNKKDFSGSTFNLSLFTINGKTKERFWVGEINNLEVISRDSSIAIYKEYEKQGWVAEMASQLKSVSIDPVTFLNTPPEIFFNVRFKQSDLKLLDIPLKFSRKDGAVLSTYYSTLLNKKQEPELEGAINKPFEFIPGHTKGKEQTTGEYGKRKGDIDLFHNRMQTNVYNQFVNEFGFSNVGTEQNAIGGTKIDLILKIKTKYWFYEFKTSNSIKACIREALPQLLEYTYWHKKSDVEKLIISSQNEINDEAQSYLNLLRDEFKIPVYYQRYNSETGTIESKQY